MTQKKIQNFIYPDIKKEDRQFGISFTGEVLRPDGDWRPYLPNEEAQNKYGVESSACYVEASQRAIATILEEQFGIKDSNFSARFNALLSNGTPQGGDPLRGGKSIKFDGLVDEAKMPFNEEITSWEDFHSWKGVNIAELRDLGQKWVSRWRNNFKIVFEKDDELKLKYIKLRNALKYSPVPVSVSAWFEESGEYIKPKGMNDNHLTLAVYVDEKNRIHVWDSYSPYLKILCPNYECDFAMSWSVFKLSDRISLIDWIKNLLK